LREVVEAFREGGGEGKRMLLQVPLAFAPSREEALRAAHEEWRGNIVDSRLLADLRTPEDFEAAAAFITPADMDGPVRVSADPEQHADWIRADIELGFDAVYLHNVHRDQARFIDTFGADVLPQLRG
jgi:coenzyme F420-dependent glucose-6-phosphate dehydrogenase